MDRVSLCAIITVAIVVYYIVVDYTQHKERMFEMYRESGNYCQCGVRNE